MHINSVIEEVEGLGDGIRVEITDGYIRVSGDAFFVKGKLKLLGFRWNPKNREWYYSAKGAESAE